jgi:DNA-binding GntR family transcriptional regulator
LTSIPDKAKKSQETESMDKPGLNSKSLLQSQAYNYLKEQILSKKLEENVLYSETKLAFELGISRTPLRESLHFLSQDGYITIIPSKGFMIRRLTEKDMKETIQIRCAIEGFCTHEIAENKDSESARTLFSEMEGLLAGMKTVSTRSDNYASFMEYDHQFHLKVVSFADNREFSSIFQRLMYLIHLTTASSLAVPGRLEETISEHESYFENLKKGNASAAYTILINHLMMPLKMKIVR